MSTKSDHLSRLAIATSAVTTAEAEVSEIEAKLSDARRRLWTARDVHHIESLWPTLNRLTADLRTALLAYPAVTEDQRTSLCRRGLIDRRESGGRFPTVKYSLSSTGSAVIALLRSAAP